MEDKIKIAINAQGCKLNVTHSLSKQMYRVQKAEMVKNQKFWLRVESQSQNRVSQCCPQCAQSSKRRKILAHD